MARTKKFTPILLSNDLEWVEKKSRKLDQKAKELERILWEIKKIFKDEISDDQILKAISQGLGGVDSLIRAKSNYENGDINTILGLWGTQDHYHLAKSLLTPEIRGFVAYYSDEFTVKDGNVTISKKVIDQLKEVAKKYTTTEAQNKAYEELDVLANGFNHVFENSTIDFDEGNISAYTMKKLDYIRPLERYLSIENGKVVPNKFYIEHIK